MVSWYYHGQANYSRRFWPAVTPEINPSTPEVYYERMRPTQIRTAREACPAVYVPIATLEWHEKHDPLGLDGLKAQGLAERCTREGGGLVFPTLYYGENREGELIELFDEYQPAICETMGLDPAGFATGYMGRKFSEQSAAYRDLLLHILYQARSLGFRVIVFVAGHYPLLRCADAACRVFHQECRRSAPSRFIPATFSFSDYELVTDVHPDIEDHAGFWETSLLMALFPELVDLNELPADEKKLQGVLNSSRPVREASAEFGEEAVGLIVGRAVKEVQDRLKDPARFYQR